MHLVFGGRGPGLTFGLHGVRTRPHAKSQWVLAAQMRALSGDDSTDWLNPRAGKESTERMVQGGDERKGRASY